MKRYSQTLAIVVALLCGGCASSKPRPLTYLALSKPSGAITNAPHRSVNRSFSRGGFYFLNYNFRPAADVASYVQEGEREAGTMVLRDADVTLTVPFAIDILLFGYNGGTDSLTAGQAGD